MTCPLLQARVQALLAEPGLPQCQELVCGYLGDLVEDDPEMVAVGGQHGVR
jgi:hypothetical protein